MEELKSRRPNRPDFVDDSNRIYADDDTATAQPYSTDSDSDEPDDIIPDYTIPDDVADEDVPAIQEFAENDPVPPDNDEEEVPEEELEEEPEDEEEDDTFDVDEEDATEDDSDYVITIGNISIELPNKRYEITIDLPNSD